jgi:hypothetical protein
MKSTRRLIWFLPSLLVLLSGGCQDESFPVAEVSGIVRLDGIPLNDAQVVFMPEPVAGNSIVGPFSSAITDENGRYTLETRYGDSGAVVGVHVVTFQYEDVEPVALLESQEAQQSNEKLTTSSRKITEGDENEESPTAESTIDSEVLEPQEADVGLEETLSTEEQLQQDLRGRRLIPLRYSLDSNIQFTVPRTGSTSADFDLRTDDFANEPPR